MLWEGQGLEGSWGIPVLWGNLMDRWRWEAVGWEGTSGCWLLTEECCCLRGPKMKQNLWHQCNVLRFLLAHDAHGQGEQREKSQQHAANVSTSGTGHGSHQHKNR